MIHRYKLNGFNIVLDVASGSIHSVDAAAYEAIGAFERGGGEAAAGSAREACPGITEEDVAALVSDIAELERKGKLFSPDVFSGVARPRVRGANSLAGKTLKALCMNVSHMCNMSCSYCFAGRGEYGGGGLMSFETGRRAIDFLVESSEGRANLDVDFFGGEPLLNWEVVKEIVGYSRGIEKRSGKRFRFTLTTNGLLIDDDVICFTNREMDTVVLSLDGRPGTHDASRKLSGGGGSYDAVVPKFNKLVEARGDKGYYIRGTFTRSNIDFFNDIKHIADLGFSEISMEPVVAPESAAYGLREEDLPALFGQYELLAAEMLAREREGRGFRFYHYNLDLMGGPCVYKRVSGCGVGTEYLAVTPRGELYPCHQFIGDEAFLLGDVQRGVVNEGLRDELGSHNIYSRGECLGCWARFYCSGGCAANAYRATGSAGGVYELGCELLKKRVECAVMLKVAAACGR